MGLYANPSDCTDPALKPIVTEAHCLDADASVSRLLRSRGIAQAEIDAMALPNPDLTALAIAHACALAALEAARGNDTTFMDKHDAYKARAKGIAAQITRQSLGLELAAGASGGYGSIVIGRG
jgi:hypothetical protein